MKTKNSLEILLHRGSTILVITPEKLMAAAIGDSWQARDLYGNLGDYAVLHNRQMSATGHDMAELWIYRDLDLDNCGEPTDRLLITLG